MPHTGHMNKRCTYKVWGRTGVEFRGSEWEVTKRYGREIWERYAEYVDHDEWCKACENREPGSWAASIQPDPFTSAHNDAPPF